MGEDASPGAEGWALDRQVMDWVIPFHEGAIRYYKEVGKWTPAEQKHQEGLLARDGVLQAAWKHYADGASSDDKAFEKGWMKARADGLQKAGMNPIWSEWE